jgi:signal transduction histidine kinase
VLSSFPVCYVSVCIYDITFDRRAQPRPRNAARNVSQQCGSRKTILTCAAHQKRVIDDVLILNRLEHLQLSITPVPVRIAELVNNISYVFQVELDADGTSLTTVRDPSFDPYAADLFCLDPSRLTQIFMNLMSNAIKFIQGRSMRKIVLRYGAALEPPGEQTASMTREHLYWSPISKQRRDLTLDKDWGQREPL